MILKKVLWLPIAVYVPALTFSQVSGIDIYTITPVVIIICTFYTCVGGIKGVVWTDVLQSIIMFASMTVLIIKGTIDIGGFRVLWQRNLEGGRLNYPEMSWDPTVRMSVFSVFVGGTFFKLQNTSINQPTVQRFMSLPSLQKIKETIYTFSIGLTLLYMLCIYVGLLAYATYYDCDPMSTGLAHARDQLIPVLVMDVLGKFPGMPGLFVAGVFSAALSSLSTYLNSLSAVVLEDFVKPNIKVQLSERNTAILMRVVVVVFGLSSLGLVYVVEKLGMVLQLAATLQSILYGPMCGIFTVGMLMPWINEKSVLAGSICSFLSMAWICVNAQIASVTGTFRHTKLPISIEGCEYEFDMTKYLNSSSEYLPVQGNSIYHISFLWYTCLGTCLVIVASNVAALFFGLNDIKKVDQKLLAPFMATYLKKQKYDEVKLQENIELNNKKYFEKRFSRRMRTFGAALFNLKTVLWMPIAVYVPALTFSQVSGIDIHTITPVVIIICTFYTCVGGIKGVVYTDVLQSIIMFTSMIVLIIKGTIDIGGLQVLWQRSLEGGRLNYPEMTWDPTVRMSVLSVFVGGTFFKLQNTSINQPTVQRFMSLPSLQKIKETIYTFSIGLTLLYMLCVYVGLLAFATYYDCDPMSTGLAHARDQLIPVLVMDVLGKFPGMPGLFVAGVFSAALSSLSTYLNSLAAVVLEDFVKPNVKVELSERKTAIIMRSVVVVFGLSSMGLVYVVEKLGMVLQLSATLQSILYGPMCGIFTVGMVMPWINEKSVLAGSICSFLSMAWICVNAQIASVTGTFRHTKLPVSIEGCEYEFDMTKYLNSTSEYLPVHGNSIYHISFLWYTGLGACLVIVCSNVASLFFGLNDVTKVDEKLLAPFVAKYLRKYKYAEVKLQENVELDNKKINYEDN